MNRLSLLLIASVFLLLLLNVLQCQRGHALKSEVDSFEALARQESKDAKVWKDKEGRSHAEKEVAVATLGAVRSVMGNELGRISKEVSGLHRDLKNLEAYTVTSLVTKGEITTGLTDTVIINNNTTVDGKVFRYEDQWLKLHGLLPGDESVTINYSVRDSLSFVYFYEKAGLFGKPSLVVNAISHNPNSTITGIKNIRIQPPPRKKVIIVLYGGYGASQFGLTPQVGIGVGYKLLDL